MDTPRHFVFFGTTIYNTCQSNRTRQIALTIARRGHNVTFVELPSLRASLSGPMRPGVRHDPDTQIHIVRLCPLPFYSRIPMPVMDQLWRRYAIRSLRRWIPRLAESVLVVTTPWWWPILERLPRKRLCYNYVDHVAVHVGPSRKGPFLQWDEALLAASNLVTAVSLPLQNHLIQRAPHKRIITIPNGVRANWITDREESTHHGRSPTARPRAGFIGALFKWVDLDLVAESARRLPDVDFVLVGPRPPHFHDGALTAVPNIQLLDPIPFDQVPAMIRSLDVGLIPFKRSMVSEFADPLKLYEYCALGKPVVSSIAFRSDHRPAPVAIGETPDAFAAQIRSAINNDTAEQRQQRIAYARESTWDVRADALIEAITPRS